MPSMSELREMDGRRTLSQMDIKEVGRAGGRSFGAVSWPRRC